MITTVLVLALLAVMSIVLGGPFVVRWLERGNPPAPSSPVRTVADATGDLWDIHPNGAAVPRATSFPGEWAGWTEDDINRVWGPLTTIREVTR